MEYIEGIELEAAWKMYDDTQKESGINQLRQYMEELREIKSDRIGTIDGSWCDDHYFDYDRGGCGPFNDEAAFNTAIVKALTHENSFSHVVITCDLWLEIMTGTILSSHTTTLHREISSSGGRK
ncbi:hypothetical protein BKA67DRAFT_532152 [Truncatella angustata]|uniref:Uncharacterized protein n=1 Tax=Truncatella angustata TaxID=152316 RepID=A0A9P8URW4_9PEZI|nr:uncharacterized protein BKA67DRAFT_532152 [Truncatella angustata]KAH6656910.1 hypothetical protein BKA67DRAFT_532152 [Truncatella angustata]KAH8194133.1 hypothetical protein TruAng_011704 [Truncatella angustata]